MMNRLILAGLAGALAWAGPVNSAFDPISSLANPLDNTGSSARATGMGSAFVGVADDSSAILWNPGGLAGLRNIEMALHHNSWLAGIVQETAVAAVPLGPMGAVGASINYVNYGTFVSHDTTGAETGSVTPSRLGFGLGWGTSVFAGLSAGITAKASMQTLANRTYSAFSGDLGALWTPVEHIRIGLVYANLGMKVVGYALASTLRMGGSYQIELVPSHRLLVAVSGDLEPGGVNRIELGAEDLISSVVAVRVGYQASMAKDEITGLSGLAAGLGVVYRGFGLDYAFLPFGDLGTAHRISVRYTLGGS